MKILLLFLASWCLDRTSTHRRAWLSVTPGLAQYFEYQNLTMTCEQWGSAAWTLWRYSRSGSELSQCGSGWGTRSSAFTCQLDNVKPYHSGVYWCQSTLRDSSNAVSITVTEGPLVLESPVLPVPAGVDVTLRCQSREKKNQRALFYKNDHPMSAEPSDRMIVQQVSRSDEAVYRCGVSGGGESASSWLMVEEHLEKASLTVVPDSAQLFEYDNLMLSCGVNSSTRGWTVRRFTTVSFQQLSSCGQDWGTPTLSGCQLDLLKQPDSAIYWCESPTRQRSNSVNINVIEPGVILQSPALPVSEGHNVTLTCRAQPPGLRADFFKNGTFVGSGPAGSLTLYGVTGADVGDYSCDIRGHGASLASRLHVRELDAHGPGSELPPLLLKVTRYLLVCSPYVALTLLMVWPYQHKLAGGKQMAAATLASPAEEDDLDREYEDGTGDVTTEHHF